MKFWRLALGVTVALFAASPGHAQDVGFATVAIISETMGVNDGRICTGEFSRGDIGCASNAPYVSRTTGSLGIGTTSPSGTLQVNGTFVNRVAANQILTTGSNAYGLYLAPYTEGFAALTNLTLYGSPNLLLNPNAAGARVGISTPNPSTTLHVSGTIRMADSGEACDTNRAGAVKWNGSQFQVCYGSGGWATLASAATSGTTASADTIVSGTTSVVANDNGYTSLTTGGVNTGYFDTAGRLVVPGISATTNQASFTTLYASGKVGIGEAPLVNTMLYVTSTLIAARFGSGNNSRRIEVYPDQSSIDFYGTGGASSGIAYINRSTPNIHLVVNPGGVGSVGINVASNTAPVATLHVSGTIMAASSIASSTLDGNNLLFNRNGSNYIKARGSLADISMHVNDLRFRDGTNETQFASMQTYGANKGLLLNSTSNYPSTTLHVSGTIRMADSGEACDTNRAGAVKWNGSQFQVCYGSGGWALLSSAATSGTTASADTIVSGTTSVIANSNGYTSLTTGGVNTGYFDTAGRLVVPGISATTNQASFTTIYASREITAGENVNMATGRYLSWSNGSSYIMADTGVNAKYLRFAASSTEAMRIVSTGYVGIGTSEPSSSLHIYGSNGTREIKLSAMGSSSNAYINSIISGTGAAMYRVNNGAAGWWTWGVDGGDSNKFKLTDDYTLQPSSNPVLTVVRATRNIGMGTNNPSTTLHISGTLRIADGGETCDSNRAGAVKWNGSQFQVCYGSGGWALLSSAATSGTAVSADTIVSGTTSIVANNNGSISLTTGGTLTNYFTSTGRLITSGGVSVTSGQGISSTNGYFSGNVGIGTGAPSATLHVVGEARFQNDADPLVLYGVGNDIRLNLDLPSYEVATINARNKVDNATRNLGLQTDGGNVGIGNTTPSATLHVSGTAMFKTAAADNACSSDQWGAMRFNNTTKRLQICRQPE